MDPNVAKSTQTKVARNFQLTLNETGYFDEIRNYLLGLKLFQYLIACKEKAPSTGHEHIHIYVQFKKPLKLSLAKLNGAHVEACKGSAQQNIAYIKKDGNIIYEAGTPLLKGGYTIAEVKKMSKTERDSLPLVYANIVNKINNEESKYLNVANFYKGKIEVFWYHGESGAGKTRHALKEIGESIFNEVKYDGSFWHGVTEDCEIALYDDWRDGHMKPTELINFIDYNSHIMNVKGGTVRNNYKKIYITSLQDPEKIYMNVPEETKKQWLRRIKEIIKFELNN